jgi:hypothetical protein
MLEIRRKLLHAFALQRQQNNMCVRVVSIRKRIKKESLNLRERRVNDASSIWGNYRT